MKKNFMLVGFIAFLAIIGLAFFACKNDDGPTQETPKVRSSGTKIDFDFGCATVKSDDKYLDAAWAVDVGRVKTALNLYDDALRFVFATENNAEIILGEGFDYNWEVKAGEFNRLYIKTASIESVVYANAAICMRNAYPYYGKAVPAKKNTQGATYLAKATPLKEVHIIKLTKAFIPKMF